MYFTCTLYVPVKLPKVPFVKLDNPLIWVVSQFMIIVLSLVIVVVESANEDTVKGPSKLWSWLTFLISIVALVITESLKIF